MKKLILLATVIVCFAGETIIPNYLKTPVGTVIAAGTNYIVHGNISLAEFTVTNRLYAITMSTNVNELPDDGIRYRRVVTATNRMMTVIYAGQTNVMRGEQIGQPVTNWVEIQPDPSVNITNQQLWPWPSSPVETILPGIIFNTNNIPAY